MDKKTGFRSWFYFRIGWNTYFAFVLAAINTLTITYYLAIENYPVLKDLFPTFEQYVLIVVSIGVPLLALQAMHTIKEQKRLEQRLIYGLKVIHIRHVC